MLRFGTLLAALCGLASVAAGLSATRDGAAPVAVKILKLRTQTVGDMTYFQVCIEPPKNLAARDSLNDRMVDLRRELPRQPRLLCSTGQANRIHRRELSEERVLLEDAVRQAGNSAVFFARVRNEQGQGVARPAVVGLEFVGIAKAKAPVQLELLYPESADGKKAGPQNAPAAAAESNQRVPAKLEWRRLPVTLDLANAAAIAQPEAAKARDPNKPLKEDDLEGLWADARMADLAGQEVLTDGFSYYGFARVATGRKFNLRQFGPQADPAVEVAPANQPDAAGQAQLGPLDGRLFELTTGATAISESLQLNRLLRSRGSIKEERTVPIDQVQGIDIAPHPWEKLLVGKTPVPEALAKFIPQDNWYARFRDPKAFGELEKLGSAWGGNLLDLFQVRSIDHRVLARYEQQLLVRTKDLELAKLAGLRAFALTGSDVHFVEGTDLAVLFETENPDAFALGLAALPYRAEAKQKFGAALAETTEQAHGASIRSWTTPGREVSLHQAVVGNVVILANSRVGLERLLETYSGKKPSLAAADDFRYLRTVFKADDPADDVFVCFSDPFIRNLVGPAARIKQARRLEAAVSLRLLTNAALFTVGELGMKPRSLDEILTQSKLKPEELLVPEGGPLTWDAAGDQARSAAYGSLHFLTPLIELPMERVTARERDGYNQFRAQYLGLWRQYFDPIGIRVHMKPERIVADVHILPLIQSSGYSQMRREIGDGVAKWRPGDLPATAVGEWFTHISPRAPIREMVSRGLLAVAEQPGLKMDWLGEWFFIRMDDSPAYAKMLEKQLRRDESGEWDSPNWEEEVTALFQLPITLGVEVKNKLVFTGLLTALRTSALKALPGGVTWEPMAEPHKDISIVRIQAKNILPTKERFEPSLYYALVEDGFYVSFQEDCIKRIIDRADAARKQPAQATAGIPVNGGLYFSRDAAKESQRVLDLAVAFGVRRQARATAAMFQPLFDNGLLPPTADAAQQQAMAWRWYGFVPTPADGSAIQRDAATGEVRSARHGSLREPNLTAQPEPTMPLLKTLAALKTLRADLRFVEDGVHTTVTLERKPGG